MKLYFLTIVRVKRNKLSDKRCVGYCETLKEAKHTLKGCSILLCEGGWYKYAVIEAFGPGWSPVPYSEDWYEFTKTSAKHINRPKAFEFIAGFGIG